MSVSGSGCTVELWQEGRTIDPSCSFLHHLYPQDLSWGLNHGSLEIICMTFCQILKQLCVLQRINEQYVFMINSVEINRFMFHEWPWTQSLWQKHMFINERVRRTQLYFTIFRLDSRNEPLALMKSLSLIIPIPFCWALINLVHHKTLWPW